MAVIQNKSSAVGDIIFIKTDVPIIGIIALTSFVDDTDNETATKKFDKTFRYSVDGINWSDIFPLSTVNIQGIVVTPTNTLYLEYYYKRIGTDTSGTIDFNSITLDGQFQSVVCGSTYMQSMFAVYLGSCNNLCSLAWSINVLEKIYKKGLLPNFIERGQSANYWDDQDFIDFWRSITHYFALFVCLARYFQKFYTDPILLLEYLRQRGLIICQDTSYGDLVYLMSHYYDEVRQRGTVQIIKEKGDTVHFTNAKQVDGELLRLLCYDTRDEFIFNLHKPEQYGWCIGKSSPLYKGLENQPQLNKFYFDGEQMATENFDYADYPVYNASNMEVIDGDITSISGVTNGQVSGFGFLNPTQKIKINPAISYELTMKVRQTDPAANFTISIIAWDKNNNILNTLTNVQTLGVTSNFLNKVTMTDQFKFVRCIIYNCHQFQTYSSALYYRAGIVVKYSGVYYRAKRNVPKHTSIYHGNTINSIPPNTIYWQPLTTADLQFAFKTNLGIGNNLINKPTVVGLTPYIVLDNGLSPGGDLQIQDIRLQPLSTDYSKGFINSANFIEMFSSNCNLSMTNSEVDKTATKYLLPYNTHFKSNYYKSQFKTSVTGSIIPAHS